MKANRPITSSSSSLHSTPSFLQVAIPSPLRRLFDYLPPHDHPPFHLKKGTRVLVSFGRREVVGIIISCSDTSSISQEKLKPVLKVLDKSPIIPADILELCHWVATYYHYSLGDTLSQAIPKALRQGDSLPNSHQAYWHLSSPLTHQQRQNLRRSPKQLEAVERLNKSHDLSLSEAELKTAGISKPILHALSDKGLIISKQQVTEHIPFSSEKNAVKEKPLTLNPEQQAALDSLLEQIDTFNSFLLDGITGSGKTEVYLQAIAAVLDRSKQTLVLIPEIGLTPQTVGRFQRRFNTPVVCLHSGLSDGERLKGWHQAATETAGIIIATRSGVFAPLPSLGLIIVDEEHDASYKQQDTLRYNARDLAIYRARQVGCPILLGSATPSLETYYNAINGRFQHLKLRQRAGQAQPPRMTLVDMRQQTRKEGLATELLSQVAMALANGNQVMFFLNRRGYAPSVICHDCGTVIDCPHCDAPMTIHRHPPHMHCHHCDFQTRIPDHCKACNSTDIQPAGQGTERTEQTLSELFPGYPVIRIDRDSTRKKNALADKLSTINNGQPCLLLGTQMLAKGHHFPAVTLVIIVNADAGLFSADFRGVERAGQLIMQVSGRAGRGDRPGQVMIQTYNPQHDALQWLVTHQYDHFLISQLKERKKLALPPVAYLALVKVEAPSSSDCQSLLQTLRQSVDGIVHNSNNMPLQVLGPIPAPMEKKQNRFRWQLLVQSTQRSILHQTVDQLVRYLEAKKLPRSLRWSVDIDPQDMA